MVTLQYMIDDLTKYKLKKKEVFCCLRGFVVLWFTCVNPLIINRFCKYKLSQKAWSMLCTQ